MRSQPPNLELGSKNWDNFFFLKFILSTKMPLNRKNKWQNKKLHSWDLTKIYINIKSQNWEKIKLESK